MSESSQPPSAGQTGLPGEAVEYLRWLFSWHGLTIQQKLLAISQQYYVLDESGQPRFFVVRPPRIAGSLLARLGALAISLLALVTALRVFLGSHEVVLPIAILVGGRLLSALVRALLTPYRDINVYTDDSRRFWIMGISQDNKFGLWHRFTIRDSLGQPVAVARRNLVASIWRRQWIAETPDARPIVRVREDSLVLAILRRYLGGTFWGMLRTNFDFVLPGGTRIGEYNRKLTLTDQYILDLRQDPCYLVDRRVALALAILLDTAEGR